AERPRSGAARRHPVAVYGSIRRAGDEAPTARGRGAVSRAIAWGADVTSPGRGGSPPGRAPTGSRRGSVDGPPVEGAATRPRPSEHPPVARAARHANARGGSPLT